MRLVFLFQPVRDLDAAAMFYRDALGLEEAWREGGDTISFRTPDGAAQLMVSQTDQPAGPMYLVDDLDAWIAEHPDVEVSIEKYDIPGGAVAGFAAPGGNTFYVFDQPDG